MRTFAKLAAGLALVSLALVVLAGRAEAAGVKWWWSYAQPSVTRLPIGGVHGAGYRPSIGGSYRQGYIHGYHVGYRVGFRDGATTYTRYVVPSYRYVPLTYGHGYRVLSTGYSYYRPSYGGVLYIRW